MKDIYRSFLEEIEKRSGSCGLVEIYHAVRNIPYGSTGVRDPKEVIKGNLGSCSGKHLVLRDLLRETGQTAEIITMLTHFNKFVPVVDEFPEDLKRMCREEKIPDFHHYVRVLNGSHWIKLDATWHDALVPFGFHVNNAWEGIGDTVLAAEKIREYENAEDLVSLKEDLIASLPEEQRELRARFFALITNWISSL